AWISPTTGLGSWNLRRPIHNRITPMLMRKAGAATRPTTSKTGARNPSADVGAGGVCTTLMECGAGDCLADIVWPPSSVQTISMAADLTRAIWPYSRRYANNVTCPPSASAYSRDSHRLQDPATPLILPISRGDAYPAVGRLPASPVTNSDDGRQLRY